VTKSVLSLLPPIMLLAGTLGATVNGDSHRPTPVPSGGSFPTARAVEALAIVVNKSNSVDNLSFAELRNVFLGERSQWPNGQRITIVMRDPAPERDVVLRQIFKMTEPDFSRYLLRSSFTGRVASPPRQLSSAAGVRRFIFNVPGAIGYIKSSEIDDTIKVVRIDGFGPGDSNYKLRITGN